MYAFHVLDTSAEGMANCGAQTHTDTPSMALTLVGAGESLLRLEKRMHCAAASVGVKLLLDIRKDTEALGIPYDQTPAVLHEGVIILRGLPRTEDIENWLRVTFLDAGINE